jgi:hypothetical protein
MDVLKNIALGPRVGSPIAAVLVLGLKFAERPRSDSG